jgi:hypothetical protein
LEPLFSHEGAWLTLIEKHTTYALLVMAILKVMRTFAHTATLIFVLGVQNSTIA